MPVKCINTSSKFAFFTSFTFWPPEIWDTIYVHFSKNPKNGPGPPFFDVFWRFLTLFCCFLWNVIKGISSENTFFDPFLTVFDVFWRFLTPGPRFGHSGPFWTDFGPEKGSILGRVSPTPSRWQAQTLRTPVLGFFVLSGRGTEARFFDTFLLFFMKCH